MTNLTKASTSNDALAMSIEDWFDKYGVAILKREETKQNLKAQAATAGR